MRGSTLSRGLFAALVVLALSAAPAAAETTKDLLNCQKTLEKEAAKLVKQRAKGLAKCVEGLLACTLAAEVDAEPLVPCQTDAAAKCSDTFLPKAEAAEVKFSDKVAANCGVVPTNVLRSSRATFGG